MFEFSGGQSVHMIYCVFSEVRIRNIARSSTQRRDLTGAFGRYSANLFLAIAKRIPLSTLPSRMPISISFILEKLFPFLTCICLLKRKCLLHLGREPWNPHSYNWSRIFGCHTVSKALSISKKTRMHSCLFRKFLRIVVSSATTKWSITDRSTLNVG